MKREGLSRGKISRGYYALLILIPVLIYYYFHPFRTQVAYGDDLYMFKDFFKLNTWQEKTNLPIQSAKYRPVHGFILYFLINALGKNVALYYIFNAIIQTCITLLSARVLNLFIKNFLLSAFCSLVFIGISRFSYFNMSQLLNGGALEGMALCFFLLTLYHLMKGLLEKNSTNEQTKHIWLCLLFANVCVYTHERYIVLFPFIALVMLFFPKLQEIGFYTRAKFAAFAIGSILLNVFLKKFVFEIPFLVGTGGTTIMVTPNTVLTYLTNGVLSLVGVNSGPEYLIGLPFQNLSAIFKVIAILLTLLIIIPLSVYTYQQVKNFKTTTTQEKNAFYLFISLAVLLFVLLVPAVLTIRLEQRWLQAPSVVLLLMVVLSITHITYRRGLQPRLLMSLFVILFISINTKYLYNGVASIYMSSAHDVASDFKKAVDDGVINKETKQMFIWQKQADENTQNALKWSISEGYLFDFYYKKPKTIFFCDSIYQSNYSFPVSALPGFDWHTDQVVYHEARVIDLTRAYVQDSMRSVNDDKLSKLAGAEKNVFPGSILEIGINDESKFEYTGFYQNENGIRWTNGNASINLKGVFPVRDSVTVILKTYMPPICKNIVPRIILLDEWDKQFVATLVRRMDNVFHYSVSLGVPTNIVGLNIQGDTVNASGDVRVLSFPFISADLKK